MRAKIAKQLEEAEEEEDAMTRKLLEHRARVRRLRKQLRMKELKEVRAQDAEAASIQEADRLERELFADNADPIPLELPANNRLPMDGRLWMSPSDWAAWDGQSWNSLGSCGETVEGVSSNL